MTVAPTSSSTARSRTFASLSIPDYRRLWVSGAISFAAVPMQAVARGYLAFQLTGTNTALGLVFLVFGLSMLCFTPLGGVAADRLPKRTVLLTATLVMAVSSGLICLALVTDRLEFWMLCITGGVQGGAFAFIGPARLAFTSELVGRQRLMNAILLAQISMNGTRVIGPGLAGALLGVAFVGAEGVYLLVSVMLAVSAFLMLPLPAGSPRPTGEPRRSPLSDLADGIAYARAHPEVLRPTLMSLAVVAFAFPYVSFLPSLVEDVLDGSEIWLGLLFSAGAIGAVSVSLRLAGRRDQSISDRQVALAGALFGVGVVLIGLAPTLPTALLAVGFTGAATAAFQSTNNSLVLLRSDERFHGRMQSLLMLSFSAFGIFAFPLGALADLIGLRPTLVLMGTVAAIAVLGVLILEVRRPAVESAPG